MKCLLFVEFTPVSGTQEALLKQLSVFPLFIILFFSVACSNLQKVKTSELHKKNSLLESTSRSQKTMLKQLKKNGILLQNDSSNYWLWFQSADPFQFHPDRGLLAENGELLLGGNHQKMQLEQESTIRLEGEWKDSSAFEKAILEDKRLHKNLEKERKREYWMIGLILVLVLLFWFFRPFVRKRV